jgi:hypothetical protein
MKAAQGMFASSLFIAFASACFAQAPSSDKRTPVDEALELYQQFSGKTVIRSPNLPSLSEFNKPIPSSDTNGMRIVLENELLNKGIELVPLSGLIVMAVESGWKNSPAAKYIATIKPRPAQVSVYASELPASNGEKPAEEPIAPGTIDFRGASINQFLDLYAMLLNRNLLRSAQIASSTFKLHTQTPFTKSAVIYLLEVALALNGIASVDDGTDFLQVVPISRIPNLKLQAPQPSPGDPLLDPKSVRDFGYLRSFVPGQGTQISSQEGVNDMVAYYAELTGRTAVSTSKVRGVPAIFRAQTPLTRAEVLYALETTLALNGLAIIEVDDKTIRAGNINERSQASKNSQ